MGLPFFTNLKAKIMNTKLLKLLKCIWVIQTKTEIYKYNNQSLGQEKREYQRLNPINPLTYLTIIIVMIIGVLLYGFVGVWDEVEIIDSFRWR